MQREQRNQNAHILEALYQPVSIMHELTEMNLQSFIS